MNIQSIISKGLLGQHPVPCFQHSIDGLGAFPDKIFEIPVRQCDFVMTTSLDGNKDFIFLSKFTVPAFGLTFEYQNGATITSAPTISPVSITGYIPQSWEANISNFYYRQFKGGLLNADVPNMDVTINYIQFDEDSHTDFKQIMDTVGYSKVGRGVAKTAASIKNALSTVVNNIKSSIPEPVDSFDLMQSEDVLDIEKFPISEDCNFQSEGPMEFEQEVPDTDAILMPVFTFENARFSVPEFSTDLSSNDLATVSLQFSYSNVLQHNINR